MPFPFRSLLVAHGKDVLVIDPATRHVRAIGQIAYAHAVVPLSGHDRILVTSKFDDSVRILDGASGAELVHIAVARDPDATVLSADGRKAYVMAAKAGVISVVDLDSMKETGRIPLPGCEGPTGLAMGDGGLALSACANGKAALVDIAHRKVLRMLPIGMGPDTVIWDAAHHRFLVPCGESGSLSIIALDKTGAHVLPAVATGPNARTAALDPVTGRLYLPSARLNPVIKGQPKTVATGSFRVLALSPR